jgi:transcriptional regulator with XRE-family HTH domain
MKMSDWEKKVLAKPRARQRVAEIEGEMRLAVALTALREKAGLSQRELAERLGVSQPRIVAIEHARNVTLDVLEQYLAALGGSVEISFVKGNRKTKLVEARGQRNRKAS